MAASARLSLINNLFLNQFYKILEAVIKLHLARERDGMARKRRHSVLSSYFEKKFFSEGEKEEQFF